MSSGICAVCGRFALHMTRGMCHQCYERQRRKNRKPYVRVVGECAACHRMMTLRSRHMCSTCYMRFLQDQPAPPPPVPPWTDEELRAAWWVAIHTKPTITKGDKTDVKQQG